MNAWISPTGLHAALAPSGEIDLANAPQLRQAMQDLVDGHPRLQHLVLDLDQVTFMDASAFGVLAYACRTMTDRGGDLVIANAHPPVMRVLDIVGLGRQPIAVFAAA